MLYGMIFDIKEFSVFDGPGIRQTVFLKGCNLRCQWCHNPEGLHKKKELMITKKSCIDCGKCKGKCEGSECNLCGKCINFCPLGLRRIVGEEISSEELVKRILRNAPYYSKNSGGLTFSGGEPLMQGEFLLETIAQLRGIHIAVETSSLSEKELYKQIISNVDYVLTDLKIFDDKKHIEYTGVSNKKILENIDFLKSAGKPFLLRIPLIPGVTDTNENLETIAEFIKDSKTLERVELLPYNRLAGAKYPMMGLEYKPEFDENKDVNANCSIFLKYGIRSCVL